VCADGYNDAKTRPHNSKKKKVDKRLKAAHRLYQKRIAEAKAARLRDREAKKKEREAMAAELAAARAKK
jgi:hypothetical protein